jgi:hypothetical protein
VAVPIRPSLPPPRTTSRSIDMAPARLEDALVLAWMGCRGGRGPGVLRARTHCTSAPAPCTAARDGVHASSSMTMSRRELGPRRRGRYLQLTPPTHHSARSSRRARGVTATGTARDDATHHGPGPAFRDPPGTPALRPVTGPEEDGDGEARGRRVPPTPRGGDQEKRAAPGGMCGGRAPASYRET